jgi:hypothetical protein
VAIDFVDKNLNNSAISSITYLEILVYPYDEEEDKKVKMADNIIGSTAKQYGLTLVTRNVDDFKNMELDILNIYA